MNKIPTPLYQIFLNWIDQYKENINLLVNPRILVTGEYPIDRDKKSQLMDADVEVCFSSNGVELYVLVPVFASFSLIDQKVHLSITYRDITRDDDYYFEGFVEEYQFKGRNAETFADKVTNASGFTKEELLELLE